MKILFAVLAAIAAFVGIAYLTDKYKKACAGTPRPTNSTVEWQCGVSNEGLFSGIYNSVAKIFAADQANSSMQGPIIPSNSEAVIYQQGKCGYPEGFVGPLPDNCQLSGQTLPNSSGLAPAPANLSPAFWAADAVPTNPALG